jgi:hypothetical protein
MATQPEELKTLNENYSRYMIKTNIFVNYKRVMSEDSFLNVAID